MSAQSPVKNEFSTYKDSRILFKPGMENQAKIISESLDAAIQEVENAHGKPFVKNVIVHICDTPQCFSHYIDSNERIKAAIVVTHIMTLALVCNIFLK